MGSEEILDKKLEEAIWAAKCLFDRGRTTGSSGNISFRLGDSVYISGSGTCFGLLKKEEFAVLSLDGTLKNGVKPSKEWPLHLAIYEQRPDTAAVIHTHGRYAVLWSFMDGLDERDCIPAHTPYLKMKVGRVGVVPYEKPGSKELFAAFEERVPFSDAYLLKQHGAVVPAESITEAFFGIEELEEGCFTAWNLKEKPVI